MSGTVAAAADLTCHYLVVGKPSDGCAVNGPVIQRAAAFATFNAVYCGFFQRLVYRKVDVFFSLTRAPVLKKVAFDMCFHAPLCYIPCFFIATGMMQGKGFDGSVDCLRAKYVDTMTVYMIIWPATTAVMFRFLPESSRVMFLATVGYFEKMAYSWIQSGGIIRVHLTEKDGEDQSALLSASEAPRSGRFQIAACTTVSRGALPTMGL